MDGHSSQTLIWTGLAPEALLGSIFFNHHYNTQSVALLCDYPSAGEAVTFPKLTNPDGTQYSANKFWEAEGPLSSLMTEEFIAEHVQKGKLYILSHGTKSDSQSGFCILPTGTLVLSLNKDDFEVMGIDGSKSSFDPNFHICKINMTSKDFKPKKGIYDRVRRGLDMRFSKSKFYAVWINEEGKSAQIKFPSTITAVQRAENMVNSQYNEANFPDFSQLVSQLSSLTQKIPKEEQHDVRSFLEFVGLCTLRIVEMVPIDISQVHYEPKKPAVVKGFAIEGFQTPVSLMSLVHTVRSFVDVPNQHRLGLIYCWGYRDTPVSWGESEHRFAMFSENDVCLVFHKTDSAPLQSIGFTTAGSVDAFRLS